MPIEEEPIVLELAQLPREKIGPFLILGITKDAPLNEIEANWAERVKWARKQLIKIPLEDVNWAREAIREPPERLSADAASLNLDGVDNDLQSLAARYGVEAPQAKAKWEPIDEEKDYRDYVPDVEVPDIDAVRAEVNLPQIPQEVPSVILFLQPIMNEELDPWEVEI